MSGLGSELRSAERQNPRFFHDTGFREDAGTLLLPDVGQWGSHPGLGQKPGLLSIRQRGTLGLLSQLLLLGIWEFSKIGVPILQKRKPSLRIKGSLEEEPEASLITSLPLWGWEALSWGWRQGPSRHKGTAA